MAKPQYNTAAQLRKRAHNVSSTFYTDAELDTVLKRWSTDIHNKLGRATTSAYTASDDEFETVKNYVLAKSTAEVLASVEVSADKIQDAINEADDALKTLMGMIGETSIVSAHFDLHDGLDEDLYGRKFA